MNTDATKKTTMTSRIKWIWYYAETTVLRVLLVLSSGMWSTLLLWPGDTFARPTYRIMGVFAGEIGWALGFLTHFFLAAWIVLSKHRHQSIDLAIQVLGSMLWMGSAAAMLLAIYPPPAAISGEIVLSFASVWLAWRVARNGS